MTGRAVRRQRYCFRHIRGNMKDNSKEALNAVECAKQIKEYCIKKREDAGETEKYICDVRDCPLNEAGICVLLGDLHPDIWGL